MRRFLEFLETWLILKPLEWAARGVAWFINLVGKPPKN